MRQRIWKQAHLLIFGVGAVVLALGVTVTLLMLLGGGDTGSDRHVPEEVRITDQVQVSVNEATPVTVGGGGGTSERAQVHDQVDIVIQRADGRVERQSVGR